MWQLIFFTSIATLFAWIFVHPQQARAVIAEFKRQLRLWVIQRSGERAMQATAHELFSRAVQAGHDPDLVKEILEEDWNLIRDRLGGPVADEILGEPSTLERYG